MEFSQLRCFAALAEELHFARAARKLCMTQPPLSRSIQKLESELGVMLFDRTNKWNVTLTDAGKVFRPEAEKLLRQALAAENAARDAGKGVLGRLTVGAISSMIGNGIFIDALAEMRRKYPKGVVEIVDSTSGALEKELKAGTLDLAFMRLPEGFREEELKAEKLFEDELTVVLPKEHRLAKKRELCVSDLRNIPLIFVPEKVSGVFRNFIMDFLRIRGGFTPLVSQEISNSYTSLRLVAAHAGVTIVSAAYEGMFSDRLIYRRFADFRPSLPMYAVMPDTATPVLAGIFLNLLRKKIRNLYRKTGKIPH